MTEAVKLQVNKQINKVRQNLDTFGYSTGKFAHYQSVLNFKVSWPYLTALLFSLDIIWKFQILWAFKKVKYIYISKNLKRV